MCTIRPAAESASGRYARGTKLRRLRSVLRRLLDAAHFWRLTHTPCGWSSWYLMRTGLPSEGGAHRRPLQPRPCFRSMRTQLLPVESVVGVEGSSS